MTDDFDAQMAAALRTLEREPEADGRAAVSRRVARRRAGRTAVGTATVVVIAVAVVAVLAGRDDKRHVTVAGTGPTGAQPAPPTVTGILTFPTTVAAGHDFSAVLRNPLDGPNTSCFLTVYLERWDGSAWKRAGDLFPNGVDPNLAGPGADCAPDLMMPGAFLGERTYTVPSDAEPGAYRLVDQSTEGEGRITVAPAGSEPPAETRPVSRNTVDLDLRGVTLQDSGDATLLRAWRLDDNRLAIEWDSACNEPGERIEFDYAPDRVTAHLVVGFFLVTDCVGEPSIWSTVVDLPAPLWGRDLVVESKNAVPAHRVDVSPISTFVLPETAPGNQQTPILATSIFRQRVTPDSIEIEVFADGCTVDAQSAVYRAADNEVFVQPRVQQPPNVNCSPSSRWFPVTIPVSVPPGSELFGPAGG